MAATPIIRIDGSVAGAGTPGLSRDVFIVGEVIDFVDTANPTPTTFVPTLRFRPAGSAATISVTGPNKATLTIDVTGTYLVEIVSDSLSSGNINAIGDFVSTQGAAAAKDANGIRPIAAGETLQFGTDGWQPAIDPVQRRALSTDQRAAVTNASPAPSAANPFLTAGSAGILTTDEDAALAAASPLPTGANPVVTEGFARLPTANQKTDLGQLDGAAQGTIWYANNAGRVTRLAPGTSGQLLRTNGASANPSWATVGALLQAFGLNVTVDTTTSGAFTTLFTQNITTVAGSVVYVWFSASANNDTKDGTTSFRLRLDGATIRGARSQHGVANTRQGHSIVARITGLTAGLHTIAIEWGTGLGTAGIRPVANPDLEHASLIIREETV